MKAKISLEKGGNYSVYVDHEDKIFPLAGFTDEFTARKRIDVFNSALASHVESELSKTNAGYWKERCEAAEDIINKIPRTKQGLSLTGTLLLTWMTLFNKPEPPSELSLKLEKLKAELSDEYIHFAGKERYDSDIVSDGKDKVKIITLANAWREGAKLMRNEILNRLK